MASFQRNMPIQIFQHRISITNLNCFLSLKSFYPMRIFAKIFKYPVGIWIEQKGFSSQTSLAKKFSKNSQRLTGYQKKATTRGFLYFQSWCANLLMTVPSTKYRRLLWPMQKRTFTKKSRFGRNASMTRRKSFLVPIKTSQKTLKRPIKRSLNSI
jgi:hypothetical protein